MALLFHSFVLAVGFSHGGCDSVRLGNWGQSLGQRYSQCQGPVSVIPPDRPHARGRRQKRRPARFECSRGLAAGRRFNRAIAYVSFIPLFDAYLIVIDQERHVRIIGIDGGEKRVLPEPFVLACWSAGKPTLITASPKSVHAIDRAPLTLLQATYVLEGCREILRFEVGQG